MKLGIVVVYFVDKAHVELMNIHLERIVSHTTVPYTIYGLINANPTRTLPTVLRKLENTPNLEIVKRTRPDLSTIGGVTDHPVIEHAYYLDQLVRVAIKDECTHVATLHLDSFPVRDGWAELLTKPLSKKCVLTAAQRIEDNDKKPHPSGMIFTARFYKQYKPTFRLHVADFSSPDYKEYKKENDGHVIGDSGVGYGFCVWENGLTWVPLERSNVHQDHHLFGGIYGDCLFHVGAAVREIQSPAYQVAGTKILNKLCSNHEKYINWLRGVS